MATSKKRSRSRRKKKVASADAEVTPEQEVQEEQAAYDSVSVTGSGRDVTEELNEPFTEPEVVTPAMDLFVFSPSKKFEPDAPNFTHREVAKSSMADRLGIDNTPTEAILRNAYDVARHCLQKVRDEFGSFTPSSWYRSEPLERQICKQSFINWCHKTGKPHNRDSWNEYFSRKSHPKGQAIDFEIIGVPNDELYQWCVANLEFDQCIREFPKEGDPSSGWVHISYNAGNNRGQAFTIG